MTPDQANLMRALGFTEVPAGGLALPSGDTDKSGDYVFESAKRPGIRGASMLLDDLNRGWPEDDEWSRFVSSCGFWEVYGCGSRRYG